MESRRMVISRYGGPEVLREETHDLGNIAPGDVRVEVTHSGINFADIMMRMGLYPEAPKPPFTPGYEVVGKIAEVGEGVTGWKVGRNVIAGTRFGGYASVVDVAADRLVARPRSLSPEVACALPVQGITAWAGLVGHGRIRAGDKVLIHGGAGGVGLMSIALAKRHGADVYATVGSEAKARFLEEEHGVKRAFVRTDDWESVLRAEGGMDIAMDAVGGEHLHRTRRCLAPFGQVVAYGLSAAVTGKRRNLLAAARSMRHMKVQVIKLMQRNVAVSGLNALTLSQQVDVTAGLKELALDIVAGRMAPPRIDAIFDLADAGQAHQYMQDRKNRGKVLLRAD